MVPLIKNSACFIMLLYYYCLPVLGVCRTSLMMTTAPTRRLRTSSGTTRRQGASPPCLQSRLNQRPSRRRRQLLPRQVAGNPQSEKHWTWEQPPLSLSKRRRRRRRQRHLWTCLEAASTEPVFNRSSNNRPLCLMTKKMISTQGTILLGIIEKVFLPLKYSLAFFVSGFWSILLDFQ